MNRVPNRHWQGGGYIGDSQSCLEDHPLASAGGPGHLGQQGALVQFVIPLMVGTEGAALSLAKHLLTVWRWSIRVKGWDVCPPILTALNMGQFMTGEEVLEVANDALWFMAYCKVLLLLAIWWRSLLFLSVLNLWGML